ncbi:hypothetical protein L596_012216 [Steinernema carpocapsae]|uniref:Uncharacterized protein n=1 Tax=Steinernema carpocapsae TaxID=34508 RepID=A0A4U5NX80_STECR|nr:hypothetical protein L596_012216 [Steinernema carpocapsae]
MQPQNRSTSVHPIPVFVQKIAQSTSVRLSFVWYKGERTRGAVVPGDAKTICLNGDKTFKDCWGDKKRFSTDVENGLCGRRLGKFVHVNSVSGRGEDVTFGYFDFVQGPTVNVLEVV